MKAFWSLVSSDLKGLFRNRMALFWVVMAPIFFIVIFGLVFGSQDDQTFSVGLAVEDDSPAATGLLEGFKAVPVLEVHEGEREAEIQALLDGERRAVVVIPAGLGTALSAGKRTDLEVYHDPSQLTTSQAIVAILNQVVEEMDRRLSGRAALLNIERKTVQTRGLEMINFLIPGVLAMSIFQLGLFTAVPIVSQRERGILKRLGATPLPRSTLLFSHLTMRLIVGVFQTVLVIGLGRVLFGVQMLGSWPLLLGFVVLGVLTFIALGTVIGSLARTEEAGVAFTQMINFPFLFLSGIFFPVDSMPGFMQPVVKAIPVTYLGDALRQVIVTGSAIAPLPLDALILGAWLVVCLGVSIRFFRWE